MECIALGLGHIINVALEALTRPGEHVSALRELFGRLLAEEPLHNDHRATQVAKLMKAGKGVFVELGEPSRLRELALKWAGRVDE